MRRDVVMSHDWDAATYDRVAAPQARWGAHVIRRLDPEGVGTVLDAGCGSGRVTEQLLEWLPEVRVVALDGSARMLEEARRRLARFGSRVAYVHADLCEPFALDGPADAILSTATFHWVPDHPALFRRLAAVLRPGGQLVAQYGGAGNIASVARALAEIGDPLPDRWTYRTPEADRAALLDAGFADVEAWLQPEPTTFEPGEPFETFLATVVLRAHLPLLPEQERAAFVRGVAARLPGPVLDYVRLNVVARRARSGTSDRDHTRPSASREFDQPIAVAVEVHAGPLEDVSIVREQHHLPLPADRVQHREDRDLPALVRLRGDLVEQEGGGLRLGHQVLGHRGAE